MANYFTNTNQGTNPQQSALTNKMNTGFQMPNIYSYGQNQSATSTYTPPAPQTPVKKVTSGADGSQTVEYHPPTQKTTAGTNQTAGTTLTPTSAANANTYGQTITDTSGNTGTAQFNSMTGQPLYNPTGGNPTVPTPSSTNFGYNPGQSAPSVTYPGLVNSLVAGTGNNQALGANAQNIGNTAGQQISDIYKNAALASSGNLSSGLQPVGQGLANVIGSTAGQEAQGIAAGAGQQLAGNSQALTAQGQTQSALGTAISASTPTQAQYGQTVFNPLTGSYSGGSSGVATTDPFYATMQQYAQDYNTGQSSSIPSSITSNPVLNAQLQQMANTLNPNFNASTANSNTNSVSEFQTQLNTTKAQASSADADFSTLNSYAQAVGGGNTPVLQGLQKLYGSTAQGSQAVAGFNAALATVRQAWTNIVGGDATQAIPDNITANQVTQVQQQLATAAKNAEAGYQKQLDQITGGSSGGSSSGSSSGIYDF